MADKISEILVVSDMDGTLLTPDMRLLPANIEAIRLFRAMGGHFTVATGRTPASVELYPQLCALLDPVITCGGGVIYDTAKHEILRYSTLPPTAVRKVLHEVQQNFPQVGIMVSGDDLRLYKLASSPNLQRLIEDEQMTYFERPLDNLPEHWIKVLFAAEPKELEKLDAYIAEHSYPGMQFLHTGEYYFEVMPQGVSKGSALAQLCELLGIPADNTYAIGDYYNDIALMRSAGCAVAVSNAPIDVQEVANEVTDNNANAGVGQFIYKLIQRYAPL